MSTSDQLPAIHALMAIVSTCGDLPTAELAIRVLDFDICDGNMTVLEWGVEVVVHDSLTHFEQWRQGLGFNPEDIDHRQNEGLAWLTVTAAYAGVPVKLTGFYDLPDHDRRAAA
ncbi:hypothetical protein [Kitasatospora sp. GP82]|uniref:hypothetical protein n=1 Tax=Kitasatospora sp. GP82 TaxID=3035089 RepID=UPI002476C3AE|nr:hypothetical protein [Kitasatospora sp. GP82]MDH6126907.1 hypothetical protein [Kitasatospora sp. GP82]